MFGGMGNAGNMAGMMKKVQKLQAEMAKMKDEVERKTVDVSVGGGAVKVVVDGKKQLQSLKIDPSAVDTEDMEMLEDLVMSAVNEGIRKADEMMEKEMAKLTSGLKLPPGML